MVWLLNNFINSRKYTEINYTVQNIMYLKQASIFLRMLIKALRHIKKIKKYNYLGISSNSMPGCCVSPSWIYSTGNNRAKRRGLHLPISNLYRRKIYSLLIMGSWKNKESGTPAEFSAIQQSVWHHPVPHWFSVNVWGEKHEAAVARQC